MDTSEDSLHQPHDKLFTVTFSNPENAAAFLKTQLPSRIAAAIDWGRLKLEPNQFVDSHLKHSEAESSQSTKQKPVTLP
jgi:predicted transposase YdaD